MILIATQCFPPVMGGIETLMAGLADACVDDGRAVVVFADGGRAAEATDAARRYAVRRFAGLKPLRRWRKARAVAARIAEGDVERLIVDSWKSLEPLEADMLRRAGAPVVCFAHGTEFPPEPSLAKHARIASALAKADRVVANSSYTAEQAARFMPSSDALEVVTLPISQQPEPDAAAKAAVAARIGEGAPLIVTLARLEPRKGVDRLISALPALAERHPGVRLAIGGDGADQTRLEALAAELGVADRVVFLGRIVGVEKAAFLAQADLFAMTSRREGNSVEGFGLVYLEAGWHGTPALAGLDGGARDAVRDGVTARLCDGHDPAAVQDALFGMLEDRAALAKMGAAAAAHARANLWSARLAEYLSDTPTAQGALQTR